MLGCCFGDSRYHDDDVRGNNDGYRTKPTSSNNIRSLMYEKSWHVWRRRLLPYNITTSFTGSEAG